MSTPASRPSAPVEALGAVLSRRRPGAADGLLVESTVRGAPAFDRSAFELTFATIGRRLGTEVVGSDTVISDPTGRTWSIAGWGLDEVGRALVLLAGIAHVARPEQMSWIASCYRAAALRERQAVVRVLALLPEPARFLDVALEAGRASTQPVFEAIACENPYPAAFFPEGSFNQMVLKAVFTDVALARILDLETRRTAELARMASDYASERRAAGRSIPSDLALLAMR